MYAGSYDLKSCNLSKSDKEPLASHGDCVRERKGGERKRQKVKERGS